MSMANVMPKTRPGFPKMKGEDDRSVPEKERMGHAGNDLVKERSGLADMLYLRCEYEWADWGMFC